MILLWKHVVVLASAKIKCLTAAPDPQHWLVILMSDSEPLGLLDRLKTRTVTQGQNESVFTFAVCQI